MICKHCGKENKSNAKFCTNCGESTGLEEQYFTQSQLLEIKKEPAPVPVQTSSSKKGIVIPIVAGFVAIVLVLGVAFFISTSSASKDDKDTPDPEFDENDIVEVSDSVKAINATVSGGNKLKLEASPDGLYVAKVFSSDGAVLYYIPLRYYFTNYQGYESWSITDGVMKANKNTKDVKLYLTIDPTTQSVFIASAVSETKEYYGTIYTSDDNEAYIAVEGLASLLGYDSVTYDPKKSRIMFVEEGVEAVNPDTLVEESADDNNGEETDKKDKPKTNKEEGLTPAQIESKKQAEEEAKKRAEEEERHQQNQGGGDANDSVDALIEERDKAPANFDCIQGNHKYGDWQVAARATCTANGLKTRVCTACGKTESADVPKTEHSFSAWTTTRAATRYEDGVESRSCSLCGYNETRIIPKTGNESSNREMTSELSEHDCYEHLEFYAFDDGGGYAECNVCGNMLRW